MAKEQVETRPQTFFIIAPDAAGVLLAGDFTGWQEQAIPLKRGFAGVWYTVVDLPPGAHHYRFMVDGQWRDDPTCPLRTPNPDGGHNSICVVADR